MKILIALMCHCVLGVTQADAQSIRIDEASYKAYLGHQDVKVVKDMWKKVVADNKTAFESNTTSKDLLFQLALSQFGLLAATMRDKDEDLFDSYVDETEENLETLIERNKKSGEPRALLSAVQGFKMGYSPWKGMYLGSKSQSLMETAKDNSPASALVWKLYANSKYFTPETWGGDLKEAIRAYEKALQLYEADPEKIKHNWFYLDTMAFLGQAYVNDGQPLKAIEIYEKALRIEPEFGWIKMNLLPKVKKNITSN